MEKINNITPGEILLEEFLIPLKISAYRLSKDTGMPATRVFKRPSFYKSYNMDRSFIAFNFLIILIIN